MPKKKTEEEIETTEAIEAPADETAVEAAPSDAPAKKGRKAKADDAPAEETSIVESVIEAAVARGLRPRAGRRCVKAVALDRSAAAMLRKRKFTSVLRRSAL